MNKKVIKTLVIVLALCVCVGAVAVLLWNQFNPNAEGSTDQLQITIEDTGIYTQGDIENACATIREEFKGYRYCSLYQLQYSDAECLPVAESYAQHHGLESQNVLVIRGELESGKQQLKKPYILSNTRIDDFIWVLTKDAGDSWNIVDAYSS